VRRRRGPTFAQVTQQYLERWARPRKRTWREDARILARDVLPRWGQRPARGVTARDVRALLDAIVARGAPVQANRTLAVVRRLFTWAAAPDRALVPQGHNPCWGLEAPARERPRDRVLSAGELQALWRALDAEPAAERAVWRLYLLTAQRDGEVRTMAWADVDLDAGWWTIPGARAKNGLAHRVPLSAPALALLRERARAADPLCPWVFPSPRRSASGHRERVYRTMRRLRRASGVPDFTPHDLRRTAASHMTAMGVPRLTVAKVLNHVERGVTAVYDRYGYDREKREALEAWARALGAMVAVGDGRRIGFRA
jgi:integrase